MTYTYVASPYSHPETKVREQRYRETRDWIANHFKLYRSPVLFSPIVHCHDMVKANKLKGDAATWNYYNLTMLKGSTALWVLKLPGWSTSKGIQGDHATGLVGELEYAKQLNKPVKFIEV